jgi:hypothetical protein
MTIRDRNLGSGWLEPESAANETQKPEYPYNNVTETESGHLFELDDTPGRERIRLEHRTGTFIEMHPNGDEVHKVYGDGYEITIKDKNVLIKGHCSVTIEGDSVLHVKGDLTQKVDGDYELYVKGSINWIAENRATFFSKGNMKVGSSGSTGAAGAVGLSGGALRLYSNEDIYVLSGMRIGGDIVADMINARYSVDAGLGMSSGPLGFVTLTGGVSAGLPIAIPGTVSASVMVNAPLGNFYIMKANWMTDTVNKTLYNRHFHKAPKGMTSKPLVPMI